ncbi:hypothetical protein SEVIR_6G190533v4 [Setaria viridis]
MGAPAPATRVCETSRGSSGLAIGASEGSGGSVDRRARCGSCGVRCTGSNRYHGIFIDSPPLVAPATQLACRNLISHSQLYPRPRARSGRAAAGACLTSTHV